MSEIYFPSPISPLDSEQVLCRMKGAKLFALNAILISNRDYVFVGKDI
jgi:hypothetical protein